MAKVKLEENPKSKMAALLEKEEYSPKSLSRGQIVEGLIVSKSRDHLFIDIGAKSEGIISSKELDTEDEFEKFKVGDKISAYVLIPESESGQVILSMKKAGSERRWKEVIQKMDTDGLVEVKPLESNKGGFLVDFEGIRGFIPSSHLLSSQKGSKDLLKVKVLEADKKLNRLIFSEKEANPESARLPKLELPFSVGDSVDGQVSKILPFGILVTLPASPEASASSSQDGSQGGPANAEGLVHISEISWERVEALDKMFKVGDKAKVKVLDIDSGSGKINLSLKQLSDDPWKKAESKYPVGKKFESQIVRTSSYGAFVQLEPGIEGLIHSSKIPYGKKFQPGDKVLVSIDLFNPEQRRVALRLETEEKEEKKVTKETRLRQDSGGQAKATKVKKDTKSKEKKLK